MIPFIKRGKVKISTKVALSFIAIVLFQGILTQIGMYMLISPEYHRQFSWTECL